jgi:hypothetical protein
MTFHDTTETFADEGAAYVAYLEAEHEGLDAEPVYPTKWAPLEDEEMPF